MAPLWPPGAPHPKPPKPAGLGGPLREKNGPSRPACPPPFRFTAPPPRPPPPLSPAPPPAIFSVGVCFLPRRLFPPRFSPGRPGRWTSLAGSVRHPWAGFAPPPPPLIPVSPRNLPLFTLHLCRGKILGPPPGPPFRELHPPVRPHRSPPTLGGEPSPGYGRESGNPRPRPGRPWPAPRLFFFFLENRDPSKPA